MPIEHIDCPLEERHAPHNWEYADATEREAATGFVPEDVGRQALQLDDFSRWTLIDDDPATWQSDTASGSPGLHAASHENGGSDEIDVTGLSGVLADPQTPASHTHTSADITDFAEAVEDKIGAKVIAGTGISVSYNDGTGETTVTNTATGGSAGGDLAGTYPNPTVAQSSTAFALTGDISPSQLTANTNDWNPTGLSGASVIRFSTDAARDITGLQGGADGRLMILHNIGSQNAVLKDESASSTAGNRFALNADITLGADQSALLQYDATSSRWRLVAGPSAGGGGATANSTTGSIPYLSAASTFSDSPLMREDANTIAQRNSTNDQNFNVYGTFTSSSNYKRLRLGWTTGAAQLFSEAQTQTASNIVFKVGSGTSLNLGTGSFVPSADVSFALGANNAYFSEIYNNSWVTKTDGNLRFAGRIRLESAVYGLLRMRDDSSNTGSATMQFESRAYSISADTNNFDGIVPGYFQRWTASGAARNLTGITYSNSAKTDGQVHLMVNVGSNNLAIKHEDAGSTAANRFHCSTGADITLAPDQAADVIYDGSMQRWRVFKRN